MIPGRWQEGRLGLRQFTVWLQVDDQEVDYAHTSLLCDYG